MRVKSLCEIYNIKKRTPSQHPLFAFTAYSLPYNRSIACLCTSCEITSDANLVSAAILHCVTFASSWSVIVLLSDGEKYDIVTFP